MTGQDFTDRVNRIVTDLQTVGKGQTIRVALRGTDNVVTVYPVSSDAQGNVNAGQLAALNAALDQSISIADDYSGQIELIRPLSEAFRDSRANHQALIDAAAQARQVLMDALENDLDYQTAKAAYDQARLDPAYTGARDQYRTHNVSENYSNLGEARRKFEAGGISTM